MAFKVHKGKTKFVWRPITVSTEFDSNSLLAWDTGRLIAATSTSSPLIIEGVLRHAIASTDDDYATTRDVEVEVPVEGNVEWEGDVTSGLVVTDLGGYFDLTDASTVDRSASNYDVAKCVGRLSATKGIFILNIGTTGNGIAGD